MKLPALRFALAAILLTGTLHAQAPQVPTLVNYQGRVAVGAVNFEGTGQFKFALVDDTGATTFWSNDGTSAAGSEPTAAVSRAVSKGLYSVLLGDIALANMTAIPASVFTNPDVRLRVWFDNGVNGSQLLTPDQRLAPTAYLADGAVTSASIASGAVTSAGIAAGAVNGTHIAPGSLDFGTLTVPAAPTAGQILGFDGTSLNWLAPGDGIWALNGADAFRSGGNVGIGTNVPSAALELRTGSGYYGFLHSDGTIKVGSYLGNSNSGMVGGWLGTKSNHSLHFFVNNGQPSMTIDTAGKVGIGGFGVTGTSKLTITANDALTVSGAGGAYINWQDTSTGRSAAISSANGTLYYRVPNAGNTVVTAGYVDSNGMVVNGRVDMTGDVSATRLILRADPAAPTNAALLCANASVTTFVPFNTTTSRLLNLAVRDASVRVLTIYGGADLAEPFAMSHANVTPGTVVVIDTENPGKLRRSAAAYDKKVAGIVSGANGVRPGISMIQEDMLEAGENVALSGRVYVKANASAGPIEPGDLLTTSDIPGEAMKAADPARAQGSILGKAMTALSQGDGTVLVLVTLQ